ncbi:MAG: hypothetical protein GY745_03490 [Actinomycetia bacterium]|nr:hypothetical protein [Actinomycetes bacterium]MCP4084111.1 hypothetical protein [Actinomycetes bacterium]
MVTALVAVLVGTAGLVAGATGWTLVEYGLHRFAMHGRGGRGIASREHLRHHAWPERTSPAMRSLAYLGSAAGGVVLALVVDRIGPTPLAVGVALGLMSGHTAYELGHWRAHHRPAANRWERWMRPRHFHHHFVSPRTNLGVTVDVWDRVFGTYVAPGQVRVPSRLAMSWLLDDSDEVRPALAPQYRLVGLPGSSAASDLDRALADLPPEV